MGYDLDDVVSKVKARDDEVKAPSWPFIIIIIFGDSAPP